MNLKNDAVCVIGGGVMGEAIAGSLIRTATVPAEQITIVELDGAKRDRLAGELGCAIAAAPGAAAQDASLVLLAVKPHSLPELSKSLHGVVNGVVLSIIFGLPLSELVRLLGSTRVARAIPNTPCAIGRGATVWTAFPDVDEHDRARVRTVLSSLGEEFYVDSDAQVDRAAAISAAGPAFVFLLAETLVDAGVQSGTARGLARSLVEQTLIGSAELLRISGLHEAELKNQVTSPGGATARALRILEDRGFRSAVLDAMAAVVRRIEDPGRASREA